MISTSVGELAGKSGYNLVSANAKDTPTRFVAGSIHGGIKNLIFAIVVFMFHFNDDFTWEFNIFPVRIPIDSLQLDFRCLHN